MSPPLPPVEITTEVLPFACKGDDYSSQLHVTGGSGEYSFSSEQLPAGLILDASGKISGRLKTDSGKISFTVTAADNSDLNSNHKKSFTLTVFKELRFTTRRISPAVNGSEYNQKMDVTGGSGNYLITSSGLPKGLSITKDGIVSGIPDDTPEKTTTEFTVTDSALPKKKVIKEYTFSLYQPVTFTTEILQVVKKGDPLKTTIEATGGSGKYNFSAASLPAGLNLSISGNLYGTVSADRGTYEISIQVLDSKSLATAEILLPLTVVDFFPDDYEILNDNDFTSSNSIQPGAPSQSHNFNQPGDRDIVKVDLRSSSVWDVIRVKTSRLNAEAKPLLKLHRSDGSLLETISAPGEDGYSGLLYVCTNTGIYYASIEEATGETGEYQFSIINQGPKVRFDTKTFPDILKNTDVNLKILVSKGSGDYRFSAENIPSGLNLSDDGIISGRINVKSGIYPIIVSVSDSTWKGTSNKQSFNLKVVDFFPDSFEKENDNDFTTQNSLIPGNPIQHHTFHHKKDIDYTRLDLSAVSPGNIIDIQTSRLTEETNTKLNIYDPDKKPIEGFEIGKGTYERLVFECDKPGIYTLLVEESALNVGDYGLLLMDTGPKVAFKTELVPDILRKGKSLYQLEAESGSGHYRFSSKKLPGNFKLSETGLIMVEDGTDLLAGKYPFTVRLDDTMYPGVFAEKEFILTVVDFYPDMYETTGDNDFDTTNIIKPGDITREHTFNHKGDVDYLKLDLTDIAKGNVIHIQTSERTEPTRTILSLFDPQEKNLISDKKIPGTSYSSLYFKNPVQAIYTLKVEEQSNKTGDFRLTITDMGPAVRIVTKLIPDALTNKSYSLQLEAAKGSGKYRFTSEGLPQTLSMDNTGFINGKVTTISGSYPFYLIIEDTLYSGTSIKKAFTLNVVDFFPDIYENASDNDINTTNVMTPGEPFQEHTFNTKGDSDYIRLDLLTTAPGDIIKIETLKLTQETNTEITLYNGLNEKLISDSDSGNGQYAKIIFECPGPDFYYLKASEASNKVGDYALSMVNTGPKLQINADSLDDVLKGAAFNTTLSVKGGSGKFTIKTEDMPEGLVIDNLGVITGTTLVKSNVIYTFRVIASDAVHPENRIQKDISVKIVDYYPDDFEVKGDNTFLTTNTLLPEETQYHNFNYPGDVDYIRMDFSKVMPEDVIIIESVKNDRLTDTVFTLYDALKTELNRNDNGGKETYAKLVFNCKTPGIYFLKISEASDSVGDYTLKTINSGPQLAVEANSIPDILKGAPFKTLLSVKGGSGKFVIKTSNMPKGLVMDNTGSITGTTEEKSNIIYSFTVIAADAIHPENRIEKNISVKIVDYYPDEFETGGDNTFLTTNTLLPDNAQKHNFNYPGDVDYIRMDFSKVMPEDVIIIESVKNNRLTDTEFALYDALKTELNRNDNGDKEKYAKLVFNCKTPGIYFLKISEKEDMTGDYTIRIDNSGQPLKVTTASIPFAESVMPYRTPVNVSGGCGNYIFAISNGSLPAGLTLDPHSGIISGKNANWGAFSFTLLAKDKKFDENNTKSEYHIDAFMGKKLTGSAVVSYPFYVSSTFSAEDTYNSVTAFPGKINGGITKNLRYSIVSHNMPEARFQKTFDNRTAELSLKELSPVTCEQYQNFSIEIEVEVKDKVHTNNSMTFKYQIPAKCLTY